MDTLKRDIDRIGARLGRPLRVLHIGNIANNAYNNARIQRRYGIDADVISYDYYHVMSTPEWEDSAFDGEVDSDCPDWWGTSLGGWRRPFWFAQGPAAACLQYLRARNLRLDASQRLLWRSLEGRCLGEVRYRARQAGQTPRRMPLNLGLALEIARSLGIERGPSQRVGDAALLDLFALRTANGSPLFQFADDDQDHAELLAIQRMASPERQAGDSPATKASIADKSKQVGPARIRHRVRGTVWSVLSRAALIAHHRVRRELAPWKRYHAGIDQEARDKHFVALVRSLQPELEALPLDERNRFLGFYALVGAEFADIFKFYDIVQGYSIDGALCVVNGHHPFVAYEHGTLRELPFGHDFYGVATRLAYAKAACSFVTNSDVLPSVERMRLDPDRIVYLPHAFDDSKLAVFRAEHPELRPPDGPPVFFSPARQHWQDKSGSWAKGNDVLFRAAARLATAGHQFRIELIEWGVEVEASKKLIADLGIADRVRWLPTMRKHELWKAYCQSHAVVDQFASKVMGGVGFEAMALGRRLISAMDHDTFARFFGQAPPILAASSVDECEAQMLRVIGDADDRAELGASSANWIRDFHSARRIVALQTDAYQKVLFPDDYRMRSEP
jgi:hypothetical protein